MNLTLTSTDDMKKNEGKWLYLCRSLHGKKGKELKRSRFSQRQEGGKSSKKKNVHWDMEKSPLASIVYKNECGVW